MLGLGDDDEEAVLHNMRGKMKTLGTETPLSPSCCPYARMRPASAGGPFLCPAVCRPAVHRQQTTEDKGGEDWWTRWWREC